MNLVHRILHYSADRIVRKLMDENQGMSQEQAVSRGSWMHNTNIMVSGYNLLMLMTGKSVVHPGISTGNVATESMYKYEAVRKAMEKHFEISKEFREIEFGSKIDKAMNARMKGFENMVIQKDDMVFYQTNNEKAWLGPAKVMDVDKNWVFIAGNGDIKKVPKCNVKLNMKASDDGNDVEEDVEKDESTKTKGRNEVTFDEGIMTHSKKRMKESEDASVNEDAIATYWMTVEQHENFENYAVYTVEIPAKEQNTPEVNEAKHKEIENLVRFHVFEEVDDCGQERIGSRWVVTQKEKADGQKSQVKGRIVAKGFQEGEKPQSDSPTLLRESLKMYFAVEANEGFKFWSIDIRAAFLQAKFLDREVYMEPPKDVKKEGKI